MKTKEAIEAYYSGLTQKKGWEETIHEAMIFSGPNTKTIGKAAYLEATNRFLQFVKALRIDNLTVEDNEASVIAYYDLISPSGKSLSMRISEIFIVKDGLLISSEIFFDADTFRLFMAN